MNTNMLDTDPIDEENCVECKNKHFEPRLLPCNRSLCYYCIASKTIINSENFTCTQCGNIHQVPADGFPLNEQLIEHLNKKIKIDTNNDEEEFKKLLNDIEKQLKETEFELSNGKNSIKEHCVELKRKVQLAKEEKIQQLNLFSDYMIDKIDTYEKDRLDAYLKANKDKFTNRLNKLKAEMKRWNENLLELTLNNKCLFRELDLARNLQAKLVTDKEDIQSLVFNGKLLEFFEKYKNENVIGDLELNSFDTIDFNRFRTIDFKPFFDFKDYNGKTDMQFVFLPNNHFVITIIYKTRNLKYLDIFIFDENKSFKKKTRLNTSLNYNHIDSSVDTTKFCLDFYNVDQKKQLAILNQNLEITHQIEWAGFLLGCDETCIYVNVEEKYIYIYDWELKLVEKNWNYSKLKNFLANNSCFQFKNGKFYILTESKTGPETLIIINENGIVMKKFLLNFCSYIYFGSNNRLILVDQNRLIYMNSNGDLLKEVKIISESDNTFKNWNIDNKNRFYHFDKDEKSFYSSVNKCLSINI